MAHLKKLLIPVFVVLTLFVVSCKDDDAASVEEAPRAIFGFNVSSDNSGTVTFDNFSIGGDSYQWDFGDGIGTSTEENPSYTYTSDGNFTVSLTVVNTGGEASTTQSFTISRNLVVAGDMSDSAPWTFKQIWNDANNQVISDFVDGAFLWDAAAGTDYAQTFLWQEIPVEAGVMYEFSADIAGTDGADGIWFEVYFGNVDPDTVGDYDSNGKRLNINGNGCVSSAFSGSLVTIARGCDSDGNEILPADGRFTLDASELTQNGTIYLVFKSGIWNSLDNYKDGIILDNVSIKEIF